MPGPIPRNTWGLDYDSSSALFRQLNSLDELQLKDDTSGGKKR